MPGHPKAFVLDSMEQVTSAEKPEGKTGVLLVNVGTPDSPEPGAVGRYLREFLMDPLVMDLPWVSRWLLVNGWIAPLRSRSSAKLYERVWTSAGSPLLVHSRELESKLRSRGGDRFEWVLAMRYGNPSLTEGIRALKDAGISRLVVVPLYPQYSLAATESAIREVRRVAVREGLTVPLQFMEPFYDREGFLDAFAEVARPVLAQPFDWVLFSFHGLPEPQVQKTDPSGMHCLKSSDCCERLGPRNRRCYRAQCFATARRLAERLELSPDQYGVGFQSRLGRTPWIKPYSDDWYQILPKQGVRHLVVISPSFVADCLETVEEIAIRGEDAFRQAGGERITLVPSLNAHDRWARELEEAVAEIEAELIKEL